MNKGEAIAQVVWMEKLAASTTFAGERENAEAQAARLRAQHGISDHDIKRAIAIEEAGGVDTMGWSGTKLWYYEQRIHPHVEVITNEIKAALGRIESQGTRDQVKMLSTLYDDLRGLVEDGAKKSTQGLPAVQRWRNEAIRKLYWEERDLLSQDPFYRDDPHGLHTRAVMNTQRSNDLTSAQIEAAVGVHKDDHIWEDAEQQMVKEAKARGCTCPTPYFIGRRTKKREEIPGHGPGTRYYPRRLSHRPGCPALKKPQANANSGL